MSSTEHQSDKTNCTDQQSSPCLRGYKMCECCEFDSNNTITATSTITTTATTSHHSQLSYEELSNIRVRQKNLVYVVGLPVNTVYDEQTLKTNEWFGSFGKIKKVYCNKKTSHASRTGSFAAFITFYRECDAMKAINHMNGKYLQDGHRIIKATTGSTKYCSYFLRNTTCNNPQCLYLHEWANKQDIVTKEELNDFGPIHNHNNNHNNHNHHNHNHKHKHNHNHYHYHHHNHHHNHYHHKIIKKNNTKLTKTTNSKFDYTKKLRTKPPISHISHSHSHNMNNMNNVNNMNNIDKNSNNSNNNVSNTNKKKIIKKNNKKSYRKVAKLLLHELIRNNNNTSNTNNHAINSINFKMSDLLKDGMLSYDELKMIEMDQYNYYYFIQSDRVIFQQFHQLQSTQKLQKSKA